MKETVDKNSSEVHESKNVGRSNLVIVSLVILFLFTLVIGLYFLFDNRRLQEEITDLEDQSESIENYLEDQKQAELEELSRKLQEDPDYIPENEKDLYYVEDEDVNSEAPSDWIEVSDPSFVYKILIPPRHYISEKYGIEDPDVVSVVIPDPVDPEVQIGLYTFDTYGLEEDREFESLQEALDYIAWIVSGISWEVDGQYIESSDNLIVEESITRGGQEIAFVEVDNPTGLRIYVVAEREGEGYVIWMAESSFNHSKAEDRDNLKMIVRSFSEK